MTVDIKQAQELSRNCLRLRDDGVVEAVLRSEFLSRLRVIFPDTGDETWINHYSKGTEAHTIVGQSGGATASRFIDNLVGSTSIEYESDLRVQAKWHEGYAQVKDHAAGLVRSGIHITNLRGILSDTVDWYAYDVDLKPGAIPTNCIPDDIILQQVDDLQLETDDEPSADRLVSFIRKHLAREQSRPLRSALLTLDLGLESGTYRRSATPLCQLVEDGRATDQSTIIATDLWSQFVDFLEGNAEGFRMSAYVDEVYLCILARLLSANVLSGHAISSNDQELKEILEGSYFRNHYQLENMVEHDYFDWLTSNTHVERILPVAREIQRDLYAYDFGLRPEEDLFGRLMAQLARRSQRKLLGQEWTPAWLGKLLAERCLDNLPQDEKPRIIDMCCGSGSILVEVLKAAKARFNLNDIDALHEVATGFDIDPLAVSLSKTAWVSTLTPEIKAASSPIVIPIYHADSLFAITPVSATVPFLGESETIDVSLDGTSVSIPNTLVEPECHELFDRIIDWAYDEAVDAKTKGNCDQLTEQVAADFLKAAAKASNLELSRDLELSFSKTVFALTRRMAELAIARRNGIWAFILRNTYRPGLLAGQFNGLVSNPPWLAMSRLADNPYRNVLRERAEIYGIRPPGQSFLHLELGTTHLLHAVDRYLAPNSSIACLVPGTVFNGHHHEPLRQRKFLRSQRPIPLKVSEVWQVAPGTFKYPGGAIIGLKRSNLVGLESTPLRGFIAHEDGLEEVDFSERSIGTTRTAWVLEKGGVPAATYHPIEIPQQGADLMPRTAVCVEILSDNGPEYRVDTPRPGSQWSFTVKAAKELKNDQFPGYVAPLFIHRMAQSENLLPFVLGEHCPPIAIPAVRGESGGWTIYDTAEIRRMGFTRTARRINTINERLHQAGQGKTLQERIDERRKLTKQILGDTGYLIVAGAGGKHICAACLPIEEALDLVVDQTLYWQVVTDADEAWYKIGILNSHAMTEAITPFNPKGAFGERHIHALPYRLMPPFNALIEDHARIAELARKVAAIVRNLVVADAYLNDPSRSLHFRRSRLREQLNNVMEFQEIELLCAEILGTTTFSEEPEPNPQ